MFSAFHGYISLISLGFILRNICSGTYNRHGRTDMLTLVRPQQRLKSPLVYRDFL